MQWYCVWPVTVSIFKAAVLFLVSTQMNVLNLSAIKFLCSLVNSTLLHVFALSFVHIFSCNSQPESHILFLSIALLFTLQVVFAPDVPVDI